MAINVRTWDDASGSAQCMSPSPRSPPSFPWYTTVIVIRHHGALCCYEFLRMAQGAGYHLSSSARSQRALSRWPCVPWYTGHVVVAALTVSFIAGIIILMRYFAHVEEYHRRRGAYPSATCYRVSCSRPS